MMSQNYTNHGGRFFLTIIKYILAAIFLMSGCRKEPQPDLRILVTGNSNGIIEPCDCEEGPMGGLAKRATLLNRLDPEDNCLRIETGGTIDEFTDPVRYDAILKVIRQIKYDYIIPGDLDMELLKIADPEQDSTWFPRIRALKKVQSPAGQYDLSIFTLCNHDIHHFVKTSDNNLDTGRTGSFYYKWSRWKFLEDRSKTDNPLLTFWLTYLSDEDLERFLGIVPVDNKPDFVLAGGCDLAAPTPDTLAGIPVFRPGVDGMDLLIVRVTQIKTGKWNIVPVWHEIGVDIPEDPEIKSILDASLPDKAL